MKKVLIIGAGVAGKDVLREIKKSPELGLDVIGFIDDDPGKQGVKIDGTRVLGTKEDLKDLIKKKKVNEVVIAIPSAHGEKISEYVKFCSDAKVGFRIVPRVKEIIEGKARLETLRKPRVEDLLGRPVIKADVFGLKTFFKNKKVFITGAAGSIGSELSRQIAAYKPQKAVLFDWWENGLFELQQELDKDFPKQNIDYIIGNIQDSNKVKNVLQGLRPHYVFHAAAYKHVPAMEENPEEAVKNNVFGTQVMTKEAKSVGVKKFVFVSTDKAANPVNVMGATKLIAEAVVKNSNSNRTRFMAVRFGNVLDSYGSVVPIFRKQIEKGGPVTVTDKRMTRYFMTISEAAQLILKAALIGKGGELFVLDMGEPVKIVDLAEDMIRLSGYIPNKEIEIVFTGVRKGEKLEEQLFTKKEKLSTTREKKIFITESLGFDLSKLPKVLKSLKKAAKEGNKGQIRKELGTLIKNFPM